MIDREALEKRAAELKLTFAPNIGDEKLKERVEAAEKAAEVAAGDTGKAKPQGDDGKKKAAKTKGKSSHKVIDRVRHNGKLYGVGEPIELDDGEIAGLVDAGVIPKPK